jgi:triosephosphate isomerase (TIM)
MRQKIVVANWKMYKTIAEAEDFMIRFPGEVSEVRDIEIVICPPFMSLPRLSVLMKGTSLILGAQNMYWQKEGAFTGEISPLMLREAGVKYVIIGHSERRKYFYENDLCIKRKIAASFAYGLNPILCVGENFEQRSSNETEKIIREQVFSALEGFNLEEHQLPKMVVAYEPVWAIGTGTPAGGDDAEAIAVYIRSLLREKWGEVSDRIRILYGGSVKPENITEFTGKENIDGALVGNSSLKENIFADLIKAVFRERRV